MPQEFDWVSLEKGERVLWSGEPRLVSIIPAVAIGLLLIPLFGIGVIVIAAAYLDVKNTDFMVTSQGLYKKKGVLSRSVKKIGFEKVQNISFQQGVLGNYFGYGDVDISTAGSSGVEMSFNSIDSPKEIQELINNQIRSEKEEISECPECGHSIRDDWMACPDCGAQLRSRCRDCGNLLEKEWSYCPYCGSQP